MPQIGITLGSRPQLWSGTVTIIGTSTASANKPASPRRSNLPDSSIRSKQHRTGGTARKAVQSCCEKCCRRRAKRVGAEPEYVPLSKVRNGSAPENRGAVRIHLQLLPKQLAENGQNQPKEMDKPARDSVSWTDPLGALSWFLPFNCSADILPCSLSSCVLTTIIGVLALVFFVSLVTELPKVLIHRVFGAE